MSYLGKEFVLDSQENFDGFINSLGNNLPEDVKKSIVSFKSTVKLVKSGDQFTLVSGQSNGKQEVSFTPGVEFEENVFGKPAKTTTTLEGNTLTTVQKFDAGSITTKREFSDNQVIVTLTASTWDGVAKRVFKAA